MTKDKRALSQNFQAFWDPHSVHISFFKINRCGIEKEHFALQHTVRNCVSNYHLGGGGTPILPTGGRASPSQVRTRGYLHPRSGRGTSIQGQDGGYPHDRSEWGVPPASCSGVGVSNPLLPGWGYPSHPGPRSGWGWGLLPTEIAYHVLATRWTVCLLRSRRRTFLFLWQN